MEAKGNAGGEMRRVHIIYFLSRMGRIEHPHLIRVRHLGRSGVHLRDVKRWLSELRGKDMPDSFAWSYKRWYKGGYVWQDLVDNDLITPISDIEYVLKGSVIFTNSYDTGLYGEKKAPTQNPDPVEEEEEQKPLNEKIPENPDTKIEVSTQTSEIDEESESFESETSTMTDDSIKSNALFSVEEEEEEKVLERKPEEEDNIEKRNQNNTEEETKPFTSRSTFSKSKSFGASQVFRNILTCGAVETNDSAIMKINRVHKTPMNSPNEEEICKVEMSGWSQRIFFNAWNQQQHNYRKSFNGVNTSKKTKESTNRRTVSATFKPVAEPHCLQCGKGFKPEKLHTHMKYCRGMKSLSKISNAAATMAAEKTSSQRSPDASSNEAPSYLLTH